MQTYDLAHTEEKVLTADSPCGTKSADDTQLVVDSATSSETASSVGGHTLRLRAFVALTRASEKLALEKQEELRDDTGERLIDRTLSSRDVGFNSRVL